MTEEQAHQIVKAINRSIDYESKKIENKSGFWQPDQIVKWKKERWSHIKRKKEFIALHAELFL